MEDVLRLESAIDSAPATAATLRPVQARLRRKIGPCIGPTAAGRVLGVSHTAVASWLRAGELAACSGASHGRVLVEDLLEVARTQRREIGAGAHQPLSAVLRWRVSDEARRCADRCDQPPALLHVWAVVGLLRAPRPGGRVVLPASEERWLSAHAQVARRLHDLAWETTGLDTVVLFGSTARGDDRPGSDLDVLVDGPWSNDATMLARVRTRWGEALGREVQTLPLRQGRDAPIALDAALTEGRPVKDVSGAWAMLVDDAAAVRHLSRQERDALIGRETAALAALMQRGAA